MLYVLGSCQRKERRKQGNSMSSLTQSRLRDGYPCGKILMNIVFWKRSEHANNCDRRTFPGQWVQRSDE